MSLKPIDYEKGFCCGLCLAVALRVTESTLRCCWVEFCSWEIEMEMDMHSYFHLHYLFCCNFTAKAVKCCSNTYSVVRNGNANAFPNYQTTLYIEPNHHLDVS